MTRAVRVEVSKPLIFSSAIFSLFSFALWTPVAAANARPKIPVVPVCGLLLTPNVAELDCDVGNRGFEALDFTSNDGLAIPNVKGFEALLTVVSLPLALPKVLLEGTSAEAEDPRLVKPPNVKLLEGGCLTAAPRLKSILEPVLAVDASKELDATLLLKPDPKTGFKP